MSTPGNRQAGPPLAVPKGTIGLVVAGRYRITAPLGQGAASTVYLTDDLRIVGRQQDARDLTALLYDLLTGSAEKQGLDQSAGSAAGTVRGMPQSVLHTVLQQAGTAAAPTVAALRMQLLEAASVMGLPWNICPA